MFVNKALPFGFLCVACDEVIVHVKQANPKQVKDYVEAMSQGYSFVISLPESCEGFLLKTNIEESKIKHLEMQY